MCASLANARQHMPDDICLTHECVHTYIHTYIHTYTMRLVLVCWWRVILFSYTYKPNVCAICNGILLTGLHPAAVRRHQALV
jgi:hypothetical protein